MWKSLETRHPSKSVRPEGEKDMYPRPRLLHLHFPNTPITAASTPALSPPPFLCLSFCPPGPAQLQTHPWAPSDDINYPLPHRNLGSPMVLALPIARRPSTAVVHASAHRLRVRCRLFAFGGRGRGIWKSMGRFSPAIGAPGPLYAIISRFHPFFD
ncbi:hypothetical protein C8J57DRAFT_335469 [Mycena rebaudengoi]|nr:hypothetical protein C8J57DRAFT_335469 [Mycena rebaudengoi]